MMTKRTILLAILKLTIIVLAAWLASSCREKRYPVNTAQSVTASRMPGWVSDETGNFWWDE